MPWVVQVHRPLSRGAAGAKVQRRVAKLRRQAAERRRGERQSGTAKTKAAERNGACLGSLRAPLGVGVLCLPR